MIMPILVVWSVCVLDGRTTDFSSQLTLVMPEAADGAGDQRVEEEGWG